LKITLLVVVFALLSIPVSSQQVERKIIRFTFEDSLAGTAADSTITDTIPAGQTGNLVPNDSIPVNDTFPHPSGVTAVVRADTMSLAPMQASVNQVPEPAPEPRPSNWQKGGQSAFNFSQISLSNWSAGGQNSVSFNSYLNLFARYKSPNKNITWENTLDMGFGKIKQENKTTVKSDDKIDFSTKFGRKASETWFYSTLLNFRTQMAPGFKKPEDPKISDFLAPAYLTISVGMDHKFDENINIYMSPLAGKITMVYSEVLSNAGAFGVEPGENLKYEFGGFVRVQFRAILMENITVTSKLELFSNYLDTPKNFDVNSDTRINMQVNKYISANLLMQMMYDENSKIKLPDGTVQGPRVQIKQVFGMGLSYKF
jgi:hypothetical protein